MTKTKLFTYSLPHLVCCLLLIFLELSSTEIIFPNNNGTFLNFSQSFDIKLPTFSPITNHRNVSFKVPLKKSDKFKFTPDEILIDKILFNPPKIPHWSNVGQEGLGVPKYGSTFKKMSTYFSVGGVGITSFILYRLCGKKQTDDDEEVETQNLSEDFFQDISEDQKDVIIEILEVDESGQDGSNSTKSSSTKTTITVSRQSE